MLIEEKTWTELKSIIDNRYLHYQYEDLGTNPNAYYVWGMDSLVRYETIITKGTADATDFETNYQANANLPIEDRNKAGRSQVSATSRPTGTSSYFTSAGDAVDEIGGGPGMTWDFSTTDNVVTAPAGFKRKQIDITFIDQVWAKDGAVYFYNMLKGSYADFYIVCPDGAYYVKNDGTPALAVGDTIVEHYMVKKPLQGDCPMGDEFNTESCSNTPIPAGYIFRIEITVPDTDSISNGSVNLEFYRERTVILT